MIKLIMSKAADLVGNRVDHRSMRSVGVENFRRFTLLHECTHAVVSHTLGHPVNLIEVLTETNRMRGRCEYPAEVLGSLSRRDYARITAAPLVADGIELSCQIEYEIPETGDVTTTTRRARCRMPGYWLQECAKHLDRYGLVELWRARKWLQEHEEQLARMTLNLYQTLKPWVIDLEHETVYQPTTQPSLEPPEADSANEELSPRPCNA